MNKKELATGVFKHPLIQEILKQNLATSSVINRLIVEETIMEDDLEEARSPQEQNIVNNVRNFISRKLNQGDAPDIGKWMDAIETAERGENPGITIKNDDELEYALKIFKDSDRYKGAKKSLFDKESTGKTGLPPAEDAQIASFIKAINNDPKSYQRILDNVKKNPGFDLSDEQKEILKQTFDKTQSSSTAEIAGNVSTAADLIALGLLATGVGAPAALAAAVTSVVASVVAAVAQYNAGNKEESMVTLISAIPIFKLPFGKKVAGKILGSLAGNKIAEAALEYKIKESLKKLSKAKPEEAKDKLEDEFGEKEKTQTDPESIENPETEDVPSEEVDDETPPEEVEGKVIPVSEMKKEIEESTDPEKIESDFDRTSAEPNQIYSGFVNSIDEFFGMTDKEGTYSFIQRFFLKDQATMLWSLISQLNQIASGTVADTEGGAEETSVGRLSEEKETEESIPLSKKDKNVLKKEISAFVDLLTDAKRLAEVYDKYATRVSPDPLLDGSSLQTMLSGTGSEGNYGLLGQIQLRCGLLLDRMAKIVKRPQKTELSEAWNPEEKQRIGKIVKEIFYEAGGIYKNSLRPSLENSGNKEDFLKAQEAASTILELLTKEPNISQYFPRGIINNDGEVVTIKQGIGALKEQLKSLGKILRDLYMTTKDQSIDESHLGRLYVQIQSLSSAIERCFNVPAYIPVEAEKILKPLVSEDEMPVGTEADESSTTLSRHEDSEVYKKLTPREQEAVDEFIRVFLETSGSLEEGAKPSKSINKKGKELSRKLWKGLSLTVPEVKQIVKKMDRKKLLRFQRTMMLKPEIIDMILDTYGAEAGFFKGKSPQQKQYSGPEDDSPVKKKDWSSRITRAKDRRLRKEEQITTKLKPIIEIILKEQ